MEKYYLIFSCNELHLLSKLMCESEKCKIRINPDPSNDASNVAVPATLMKPVCCSVSMSH